MAQLMKVRTKGKDIHPHATVRIWLTSSAGGAATYFRHASEGTLRRLGKVSYMVVIRRVLSVT